MAKPSDPSRDSHVAVLVFPFGNHARPVLSVIRRLASAAPTTHFSFFTTAQSNSFLSADGGDDLPKNLRFYGVSDGVPEGYVLKGGPLEAIGLFLEKAPESFRRGIKEAEAEVGRRVKCVITDAFFWFAAEMAAEMEAVWVAFWGSGPCALAVHLHTDLIRQTIRLQEVERKKEETIGFIKGMEKIRVKDLPEGVVSGNLDSMFSHVLHRMEHVLPKAHAIFLNCFEAFDPLLTSLVRSKVKHLLSIGPLSLSKPDTSDSHGCLAWLATQPPASVAFISFGTVMTLPPEELLAIAEGLEARRTPFIWSLKEKEYVHLPKGFLERTKEQGIMVAWAPQVRILEHQATGVFVTHCGWNSVMESIGGGVPMIGKPPFFGDQRLNARDVEDVWKMGVMIDGGVFTKDGFIKCLDKVLDDDDDGKKMKENAMKLRGLAHEAVSVNGSSTLDFKKLSEIIVNVLN